MSATRYKIDAKCPECGCGLIEGLATDVWQERYGWTSDEPPREIEIICKECGKKHKVDVIVEEE
jgi:RNase P subunit RPR2